MSRTHKDTPKRRMEDGFGGRWPSWSHSGTGKWWKRALAKARRRHTKLTLRGIRAKEPTKYESECNWKTW